MDTPTLGDLIARHDAHDQRAVLCTVPSQARHGLAVGRALNLGDLPAAPLRSVVICGMGGSAISGDILRVLAAPYCPVPIAVHRDYGLPGHAGPDTLVVVMSYSGGTEESLAAYDAARSRGARLLAITSGGALLARAQRDGTPAGVIPGGLAPRMAMGSLLFTLLAIATRLRLLDADDAALDAGAALLARRTDEHAAHEDSANQAVAAARRLVGRLPVLYGAQDGLEAVLTRWRCQIEENAKTVAWTHVFPEMNHNEIVGWEQLPDLLGRVAVVVLRAAESDRIARRIAITLDLIRPLAADVIELHAAGEDRLQRTLDLLLLGDWVSFYLAMLTGVDPFPIDKITALKNALAS